MRALYPEYMEALIGGGSNSQLNGVVKIALLRDGLYTYSTWHQFYSDVLAAVSGTPQAIPDKSFDYGLFSGTQVAFTDVTSGHLLAAFVIYIDTGISATSRLVFYDNEATGFPMLADGGILNIPFDSAGIIQF